MIELIETGQHSVAQNTRPRIKEEYIEFLHQIKSPVGRIQKKKEIRDLSDHRDPVIA